MARKAIYKHATQVNANTYPDDGTSPVGTTEWNEDPAPQGMIGNTPTTSTITIASGVATVTDSITVVTSESSTSDTLDKLAVTNTNEYDLIYLFANTGHTITLTHTSSPSADGHVFTVSGANETLSTTIPTILIRKGTYWYGYGGGGASTPTDITVADESTDTTCFPLFVTAATGDLAPKSGSNLAFNSNTGILTATGFAGDITGDVTGDASGSSGSCTGNAATVTTNANLTGEVTSSGNAATITDNMVDEANLKVSNTPTNGYMLTAQSGNTGGLTWAAAGGGDPTDDVNYSGAYDIEDLQRASFEIQLNNFDESAQTASGQINADITGESQVYVKVIDSNNDGVFARVKKNGSIVNVQLA